MPADSRNHLRGKAARSAFLQKHPMGFNAKIVLVVFCIMALSQAMGSLYSILSFEEHYLAAMTSKYEILGKDLKRRIEQALKFGKWLDRFIGIEKLTEPIIQQASDIDEIFLSDESGHLWYTSKAGSPAPARAPLTMDLVAPGPSPGRQTVRNVVSRLHFKDGRYFFLSSITASFGDQKGVLGLAFSREVLDQKKKALLKQAVMNLALSVFITAAVLFFMIEFGFSRPLAEWIGKQIKSDENHFAYEVDMVSAPVELKELHVYINAYVRQTQNAWQELTERLERIDSVSEPSQAVDPALSRIRQLMEGGVDDAD